MSHLFDRGSRETRIRHTLKHFFSLQECYWGLLDDIPGWFARWNNLRAAQSLDPEHPLQVDSSEDARRAAESGYADWFALAQGAVADATAVGRVFSQGEGAEAGVILVGSAGLIVIAQPVATEFALVTSYRCVPGWSLRLQQPSGSVHAWEVAALQQADKKVAAVSERAAVRRALRRALELAEEAAIAAPPPLDLESKP